MKLYVLVRKDLAPAYQAVQAGHAVGESMLHQDGWKNETLVYLHVENEQELLGVADRVTWEGNVCRIFREPDIGGQATAVAIVEKDEKLKKLMQKYPLMRF